ncbi:MAG: hypothetical protein IPN22_10990 [Bacteroidetes bacterium]|jgi:hypothetical protein|nr:hypothetical protein [Bacteroidota bacterium]
MGGLHLLSDGKYVKGENTVYRKAVEVQLPRIEYLLNEISKYDVYNENKVCFIYALGGQSLEVLKKTGEIQGVESVLIERYMTGGFILKILAFLSSGYRGLFKIGSLENLPQAFYPLIEYWMAEVIIIDKSMEFELIEYIKSQNNSNLIRQQIEKDPGYFLYEVDGDNFESSTGMVQIVSYGKECSKEITPLF